MSGQPRICVVVPVYNHGLTVCQVVRGARRCFPVIAVDDGSTDETATVLSREPNLEVITLPGNQGKAAALKSGFAKAQALGFSHVITIDADGQHPVDIAPRLAAVSDEQPDAFIVGVRDLRIAQAPWARRLSNALSTWCFQIETGLQLADTQCGLRVYPLARLGKLHIRAQRYAYELEILVRAAWAGIPLVPCPVNVDYAAPTSRRSHFHPLFDFAHVARTHFRLLVETGFARRRPLRS